MAGLGVWRIAQTVGGYVRLCAVLVIDPAEAYDADTLAILATAMPLPDDLDTGERKGRLAAMKATHAPPLLVLRSGGSSSQPALARRV